jgi:hypothetical protein
MGTSMASGGRGKIELSKNAIVGFQGQELFFRFELFLLFNGFGIRLGVGNYFAGLAFGLIDSLLSVFGKNEFARYYPCQ